MTLAKLEEEVEAEEGAAALEEIGEAIEVAEDEEGPALVAVLEVIDMGKGKACKW